MKTFADDLAFAHDNATYHGIGAGEARAFAGQRQRMLHEANVVCVHGSVEEGISVGIGVEGNHVVDLLAGAHEADGQAQLARDRDNDAALGRAIELREDDSGDANSRSEFAGLSKPVLPGGGVENQQNIVRRAGNHFGGGALHLFEFSHEVRFGVQASGGIHDDDVGRARFGSGDSVVNNRGGVGAGFLLDDFDAVALRPDFQLLDRGGAKRVRGAEHHAAAFLAQPVGELPDAGGLARAVHAVNDNHARAAAVL